MFIAASIYLRFYIEVGVRVSTFLLPLTPPKIPSDSRLRRPSSNCIVKSDYTQVRPPPLPKLISVLSPQMESCNVGAFSSNSKH
jgi:hypothetical protein